MLRDTTVHSDKNTMWAKDPPREARTKHSKVFCYWRRHKRKSSLKSLQVEGGQEPNPGAQSIADFWELGFWPSFSNSDSHEIFLWSIYIWQHINIIKSKPNQQVIFKSSGCKNSFKSDLSLLSPFRISVWLPLNCLQGHLALNIYGSIIGKVWPSYLSN